MANSIAVFEVRIFLIFFFGILMLFCFNRHSSPARYARFPKLQIREIPK